MHAFQSVFGEPQCVSNSWVALRCRLLRRGGFVDLIQTVIFTMVFVYIAYVGYMDSEVQACDMM